MLKGQELGRRYWWDFLGEKGRVGGIKMSGDIERKLEVQDGEEVMSHDRMQITINGLI